MSKENKQKALIIRKLTEIHEYISEAVGIEHFMKTSEIRKNCYFSEENIYSLNRQIEECKSELKNNIEEKKICKDLALDIISGLNLREKESINWNGSIENEKTEELLGEIYEKYCSVIEEIYG